MTAGDGTFVPSTKSTQKSRGYERWTEREDRVLLGHPEMTAEELARLLPRRSPKAIRNRRSRKGRWSKSRVPLCSRCDERPVWQESPRARSMGLCKGCYLHEMEHRSREDARANALRQSLFKERRRSHRDEDPTMGP